MSVQQLAELLEDEMTERRWTARDVAIRIVAYDLNIEELALEMLLACRNEPNVIVSPDALERYARAFGVPQEFLRNIYESPPSVDAVDPQARSTGTPTPRDTASSSS